MTSTEPAVVRACFGQSVADALVLSVTYAIRVIVTMINSVSRADDGVLVNGVDAEADDDGVLVDVVDAEAGDDGVLVDGVDAEAGVRASAR